MSDGWYLQEIAKTELANLHEQRASLEREIETLGEQAGELQALYQKQDELLKKIFGGEYGSLEENQLEETLDQHEELRNRIVEANFKWKQAQLMVDYAFKQLTEAVEKQAQDKRPLKVKLASWFWTVWDENLDARVESSRFFYNIWITRI